jgi:hypothetical protein
VTGTRGRVDEVDGGPSTIDKGEIMSSGEEAPAVKDVTAPVEAGHAEGRQLAGPPVAPRSADGTAHHLLDSLTHLERRLGRTLNEFVETGGALAANTGRMVPAWRRVTDGEHRLPVTVAVTTIIVLQATLTLSSVLGTLTITTSTRVGKQGRERLGLNRSRLTMAVARGSSDSRARARAGRRGSVRPSAGAGGAGLSPRPDVRRPGPDGPPEVAGRGRRGRCRAPRRRARIRVTGGRGSGRPRR